MDGSSGDSKPPAVPEQSQHQESPPMAIPPGRPTEAIATVSGHFFWLSLKRAFRLQIHTEEVLRSERRAIEQSVSHITHPEHQAFLAWRRSVLLVVAVVFVPLTILRFIEALSGPNMPTTARWMLLLPAFAEALFCMTAFVQLRNWTVWTRQRQVIFLAWALYFLAPFFIYLYPFRQAFDDYVSMAQQVAKIGGIKLRAKEIHLAVGLKFGVEATLVLAPKIISLMPGLIRASIVSKLLFPGTTAPGWLMMLAAPLYALFAYVIVLLPYQITGSWHFVVGNLGIMVAQGFIGWSGRKLTIPLSHQESYTRIHRSWLAYIGLLVLSAVLMLFGLYDFITQLDLGVTRIVSSVLAFVGNVLVLTLIGTDTIIASMQRLRREILPDPTREYWRAESENKLDVFCADRSESAHSFKNAAL